MRRCTGSWLCSWRYKETARPSKLAWVLGMEWNLCCRSWVCLTRMVYLQLGCCCLTLVALTLKRQGGELAGVRPVGQPGGMWWFHWARSKGSAFRVGLQTDLVTLPVPRLWISSEKCFYQGLAVGLEELSVLKFINLKIIVEVDWYCEWSTGGHGMSQGQSDYMVAENDQFVLKASAPALFKL